jgi:hypothetical protein
MAVSWRPAGGWLALMGRFRGGIQETSSLFLKTFIGVLGL